MLALECGIVGTESTGFHKRTDCVYVKKILNGTGRMCAPLNIFYAKPASLNYQNDSEETGASGEMFTSEEWSSLISGSNRIIYLWKTADSVMAKQMFPDASNPLSSAAVRCNTTVPQDALSSQTGVIWNSHSMVCWQEGSRIKYRIFDQNMNALSSEEAEISEGILSGVFCTETHAAVVYKRHIDETHCSLFVCLVDRNDFSNVRHIEIVQNIGAEDDIFISSSQNRALVVRKSGRSIHYSFLAFEFAQPILTSGLLVEAEDDIRTIKIYPVLESKFFVSWSVETSDEYYSTINGRILSFTDSGNVTFSEIEKIDCYSGDELEINSHLVTGNSEKIVIVYRQRNDETLTFYLKAELIDISSSEVSKVSLDLPQSYPNGMPLCLQFLNADTRDSCAVVSWLGWKIYIQESHGFNLGVGTYLTVIDLNENSSVYTEPIEIQSSDNDHYVPALYADNNRTIIVRINGENDTLSFATAAGMNSWADLNFFKEDMFFEAPFMKRGYSVSAKIVDQLE